MPPRYQTALRKKYLEDRPVMAIAEELSMTEKAVEGLLSRAREAFRNTFKAIGKHQEESYEPGL
jgi:DNA-directed RNA polymerase specialized sigma24 family protein